jgi:hypothetical protein
MLYAIMCFGKYDGCPVLVGIRATKEEAELRGKELEDDGDYEGYDYWVSTVVDDGGIGEALSKGGGLE